MALGPHSQLRKLAPQRPLPASCRRDTGQMGAARFALVAAIVLLASSLTVEAGRNTPAHTVTDRTPVTKAQALAAYSQWARMRRLAVTGLAPSPAGGADMTPCPADNHSKSYFWQKPVKQLFFALAGKSACASLPPYIMSSLSNDLDLTKHFELDLFGSMQDPVQLQYTIGQQTTAWNLTSEVPAITDTIIESKDHKLLDFVPKLAQCKSGQLQQQCQAMCAGLAIHFQPVCPNGHMSMKSAESIVCGFTQMDGMDSKCLDSCKAAECVL